LEKIYVEKEADAAPSSTKRLPKALKVFDLSRREKRNGLTVGLSLVSIREVFLIKLHLQIGIQRKAR
jgi:hypothetical protein